LRGLVRIREIGEVCGGNLVEEGRRKAFERLPTRLCPTAAPHLEDLISQGKAAEIAGLNRADFLEALFRAKVPACQITVEELKEELETWHICPADRRQLPPDLAGQDRAARLSPRRRARNPLASLRLTSEMRDQTKGGK
jgi:Uncharacterised protein family (UPF0175)